VTGPLLRGEARTRAAVECRRLYEEGYSIRMVADAMWLPYTSTYWLLGEAGTTFRPVGRAPDAP
jgi:hypothetical protein